MKYAIVGLGSRSYMYTDAIHSTFKDRHTLVALCDLNQARMEAANKHFKERYKAPALPMYPPSGFERMIRENKVDAVIVTSMDRTHHDYISRAMRAGCDVITEKPMTVDIDKAKVILDAIKTTGKTLRVTFNYRYAPRNSAVKDLLMKGAIGEVKSVHFEWLLDTKHGADYFRRWHRDKRNSGGLMVHKATHHFDLVNWWLDSSPATVFGFGGLVFYGRENAERRGIERFYDRATGNPNAAGDPFALDLSKDPQLKAVYLDAEKEDGYRRDESVFGHYISIEDDMAVLARYKNGATMSYHLTAYSPWEGYRVMFNGTKGRLELEVIEQPYVSGAVGEARKPEDMTATIGESLRLLLRPHWDKPVRIPVDQKTLEGHGGGDERMLYDIFVGDKADPLGRAADHVSGARSILTGIAANTSFNTGMPVRVDDLLTL
jgi:predicted dehydrogenase